MAEPPASPQASRSSSFLALFALAAFLAMGAATAAWIIHDLREPRPSHPPHFHEEGSELRLADKEESLARVQALADALLAYRERLGGGLRWPSSLEELKQTGFLPDDFDLRGPISQAPLAYQPDMPPSYDPGLWVLVHDRLEGRAAGRGRLVQKATLGAVVMFADGSVRFLDEKEVTQYGGLSPSSQPSR
ncbi:hypothetical protein EDM80_15350 [bacterium]|nr:MAG: hypothetical protein EDM80_15350 [bacterium]